jgi:hypothetical protein
MNPMVKSIDSTIVMDALLIAACIVFIVHRLADFCKPRFRKHFFLLSPAIRLHSLRSELGNSLEIIGNPR